MPNFSKDILYPLSFVLSLGAAIAVPHFAAAEGYQPPPGQIDTHFSKKNGVNPVTKEIAPGTFVTHYFSEDESGWMVKHRPGNSPYVRNLVNALAYTELAAYDARTAVTVSERIMPKISTGRERTASGGITLTVPNQMPYQDSITFALNNSTEVTHNFSWDRQKEASWTLSYAPRYIWISNRDGVDIQSYERSHYRIMVPEIRQTK